MLTSRQAGNDYNNKAIPLDSKIEARDCNADIVKSVRKVWVGVIGCQFYIDKQQKTKEEEFNAYTVHLDLSQFNDETITITTF